MDKAVKIILLLIVVSAIGFYIGTVNRQTEVFVQGPNNTIIQIPNSAIPGGTQTLTGGGTVKPSSVPWYISRAAAITAYLLMFFIIVWGAGMTTGYTYKLTNPVNAWGIHKYMSISLGVAILVHMISLLLDKFVNFKISDILIPYHSSYRPFYLSLGIISFYILSAVILSSLLVRIKAPKFWRGVHYFVYPLFIFSLLHGIFIGTDSADFSMRIIYWFTGIIFAGLIFYRVIAYLFKK